MMISKYYVKDAWGIFAGIVRMIPSMIVNECRFIGRYGSGAFWRMWLQEWRRLFVWLKP